ncbi:hypothetical protein [Tessaracoccus sp. Z1128]
MTASPSPHHFVAPHVRRMALVEEVMAGLEGLDDLPLDEQTARLGEAQAILAGVLNNDPGVVQPGIPGVGR